MKHMAFAEFYWQAHKNALLASIAPWLSIPSMKTINHKTMGPAAERVLERKTSKISHFWAVTRFSPPVPDRNSHVLHRKAVALG